VCPPGKEKKRKEKLQEKKPKKKKETSAVDPAGPELPNGTGPISMGVEDLTELRRQFLVVRSPWQYAVAALF
jgi:hypothetical protein